LLLGPISWLIFLLFFPASLGLLSQVIGGNELSHQLLALALLLLCVDQARMAVVDLEQVKQVKQKVQDARLDNFYWVTVSTIVLELLGFYSAYIWLGWGAILVLLSQIWFNVLAGIQLQPAEENPIQSWGIPERSIVLVADVIGLILVSLWIMQLVPLWMASGLLGMLVIYGWLKYAPTLWV
jgi:hypothetical protein